MLFDVEVDNPYAVPLPMSNVDYALSSQGQQFLTGKGDVQGTVPAGGSKTLGVPVQISFLELINAVKGARPGVTIPRWQADTITRHLTITQRLEEVVATRLFSTMLRSRVVGKT